MSRIHLVKNAAMSMLNAAGWAKTSMSPIQPSRSSRCGQSVGMLCMLSRWVQTMLCISVLSSWLEHSNWPVIRGAEWNTRPVSRSAEGFASRPVTST